MGIVFVFFTTFGPSTDTESWENAHLSMPYTSLTLKEPWFSLRIPFISSHYTLQEQRKGNCFSQSIQKQKAGEYGTTVPEQRTVNPAEELQGTETEEQHLTKEFCLRLKMS